MLRFLRRWTTVYLANLQAAVFSTCEIEHVPKDKTAVIYNALDLDRFTQLDKKQRCVRREQWNVGEGDILVGAVANLRPVKKLKTSIQCEALLNKESAESSSSLLSGKARCTRNGNSTSTAMGSGRSSSWPVSPARRHRPMPRGIRYRRPLLRRRKLFQLADRVYGRRTPGGSFGSRRQQRGD